MNTHHPPLPDLRHPRWLWLLPRLAFFLFIVAVVALLWVSNRSGNEEQRSTLISDMLWLEQVFQFQLSRNEELLGEIGPGQAADASKFTSHARSLLGNQTGLRQIRWFDANGALHHSLPAVEDKREQGDVLVTHLQLAKTMGKATYGPPYNANNEEWRIDVFVPLFRNDRYVGAVVGSYGIQRMLEEAVPWWLVERYRVEIADTPGRVMASRATRSDVDEDRRYQLTMEPPGEGLFLQATPYRAVLPWAMPLLSAALVLLAGTVVWSFRAQRRHVQRRQEAEEALREEHAFRQAMEDSLDTGLRARDLEGRITYVNPAFCRMVGWSAEELIGHVPPMPYWAEEEKESAQALSDRILAGHGPRTGYEILYKRSNGETFPALIHTTPLIDAHGVQTGWMSSIVDITAQKQAEEQARQQDERLQTTVRLVTMGEMASSLAHELNQPLAAIASYNTGCLNLLTSGKAEGENLKEIETALKKSADQAQRAGRIIRRIYEFVRRSEPKSEPFDPNQLLEEVAGFVDADARRKHVRLELFAPLNLPHVTGDRVLIAQALLNLVRNGIDAAREGTPPHRVEIRASVEADKLHLAVLDSGPGISPELATRLFEPFHTTKPEGMGMGLKICRSVVEGHKGRLWHEPRPEGGSVFHVLLPINAATAV
ncbi:MAG TPA: PAS domain S-box protein [Rhodocyclaceae bacterium]|nr:PAS domain S-box protein [Rhodocyclaceae bacterium]